MAIATLSREHPKGANSDTAGLKIGKLDPPSRFSREVACNASTPDTIGARPLSLPSVPFSFSCFLQFSSVHVLQLGAIRSISPIEVNKGGLRKTQNCVNDVLTGA